MAGYAYLDNLDPIDRILASVPELESKHSVPIFWLVMFDEDCVRDEPMTGCSYAGKEGPLFSVGAPYLVSDAATAMTRWKKRNAALQTLVGEPRKKLLRDFAAFARRLKPSVLVRLEDVGTTKDVVRAALRQIAQLDDAAVQPQAYLEGPLAQLWAGPDWATNEDADHLLSGWGWQVTQEERAKRARERKWQKAVGDRPDAEQVPYAPTRTYAPDEVVAHQTLGAGVVVRIVDATKIEVLFRDGPRTLVHGRK